MEDTIVNDETVIESHDTGEVVTTSEAPKPGEKTDPALLLESLREERRRRKELEADLEEERRNKAAAESIALSDEGKALERQISDIQAKLSQREEADRLAEISKRYPVLGDKSFEFEEFRKLPENRGLRIETAAKAFVIENDLVEPPKVRKGLESGTGGERAPAKTGRTPEEIDELRINNFRQYKKELLAGTL